MRLPASIASFYAAMGVPFPLPHLKHRRPRKRHPAPQDRTELDSKALRSAQAKRDRKNALRKATL